MKLLPFTQVATPCLAAILGLVILGLGADIMAFTTNYFKSNTAPGHNLAAQIHYEAILEHNGYDPAHMPYNRPALLVSVGALCLLVNGVTMIALIKRRQSKTDDKGKNYIHFAPTAAVLFIDVVLLLLTLASTIYAWWPAFDPIAAHKVTRYMVYGIHPVHWVWNHKNTIFDPVNWFCALYPFIPEGAASFDETRATCREGNSLLNLLIALVLVQAIGLAGHSCGFYKAKKAQKKIDEKLAEESD